MNRLINKVGFVNLNVEDMTEAIGLSVAKMRLLVKLWQIGEVILGWIKMPMIEMARLNAHAMQAWDLGLKSEMFGYYAQVATKQK